MMSPRALRAARFTNERCTQCAIMETAGCAGASPTTCRPGMRADRALHPMYRPAMRADRALHPRRSIAPMARWAATAAHAGFHMQSITAPPAHPNLAMPGFAIDRALIMLAAPAAQLRRATAVNGDLVGVAETPRAQHAHQCRAGLVPVRVEGRCTQSSSGISHTLLMEMNAIEAPASALLHAIAIWNEV